MKKIIIICFIFILGLFVIYKISYKKPLAKKKEETYEMKGIFISYIDYSSYLKNKSVEEKKKNINTIINNINDFGFNTILLQVRPFADAIYESKYFKPSKTVVKDEDTELDLDILQYFIEESHKLNIKVHAWVNPYRIRTSSDTSDISTKSFFYDWLEDSNNNVEISKNGIYFNPASEEVLELILNGIKEIARNYDVDGILYDDYFYPNETIDLNDYDKYISENGTLSIEEFRINNINKLIKSTYKEIKEINKNILFGISPAGNIKNNKDTEYLDIEYILKQNDYLDYVMPQLYYGFFNDAKPYNDTFIIWNNLISNDIKLYPALSIYKSGLEDSFAGSGENEWEENDDIIKKQIIVSRAADNYEGFSIFRYDYLFNKNKENDILKEEINNLKEVMDY